MKSLVIAMPALLLLGACGTTYVEPEGNTPLAKVRIRNTEVRAYRLAVSVVDPEKCEASAFIAWVSGGREPDPRRVGMRGSEEVKEGIVERQFAAGKAISFTPYTLPMDVLFRSLTREQVRAMRAGVCSTPIFEPKAGEEYEILFTPTVGNCSVTLVRLTTGADRKVLREDVRATGSVTTSLPDPITDRISLTCRKS
jgi:hypothetical protein